MICSKCNHEEPKDFKFCSECGSRQVCHCGESLNHSGKFCMECGTNVDALEKIPFKSAPAQQIFTQEFVQQPIQKITRQPKTIITDDNGIDIKLKGIFNKITTSMFLFTFILVIIALFIPLYSIFDEMGSNTINLSILTYIYNALRFNLGYTAVFRGGFYFSSAIIVIIFIILGTIQGIKSFKDDNDKIADYGVTITILMFAPLLFTGAHISIFLSITLAIAFTSIFTKIIFNVILNRKKHRASLLASYILNVCAIFIFIISLLFIFGQTFEVLIYESLFGIRVNIFQLLESFGTIRRFSPDYDAFYLVHSRHLLIAIATIIILLLMLYILQKILAKAVKLATTKNYKNFIFYLVAMFLGMILLIVNLSASGDYFQMISYYWDLTDGLIEFWQDISIRLTVFNIVGLSLMFISLVLSIIAAIIFNVNKNKIRFVNDCKVENQLKSLQSQQSVYKLPINKAAGILTFVSIGLVIISSIALALMIGNLNLSTTFAIIGILGFIALLLDIALIILYIIGLSQSKKNDITISGHIFGIISIGLFLLSIIIFILFGIFFSDFLVILGIILSPVSFTLMILAGIFILIAKPKVIYLQETLQYE